MVRRVVYQAAAVVGLAITLAGCGFGFFGYEQRAAWRDREERACMSSRPPVVFSAWVQPERKINGDGACGILYPLKVYALDNGSVRIGPTATLDCPMTTMLEDWFRNAVQPAAMAWFGSPIVQVKQLSNYSCRTVDSIPGKNLSEHAFGNAIDIAAFTLANGREITVKQGWRGAPDEQGFLREVEASGCETFKTTLGPGEPYHSDHFHLDLAHHGRDGTRSYCNPKPAFQPPRRAPYGGGLFARSNIDWMRTGSVTPAAGATAAVAAGSAAGEADPFGAPSFGAAVTGPPAFVGN
jgi:hypothetical protein